MTRINLSFFLFSIWEFDDTKNFKRLEMQNTLLLYSIWLFEDSQHLKAVQQSS